jgi:allantoin racemase
VKLLVVNVNTTETMTAAIAEQARAAASSTTEIIGLTPRFGAASVEGNFESYLSAVGVMDAVASYSGRFDAIVQAGYGEYGREGLQELTTVPVVDITEAGAHVAMLLGNRFSVVTTLARVRPAIEGRLRLAGLWDRCASVRASGVAVLDLERDRVAAREAIIAQASAAVQNDEAEVICLGCAGMTGLDEEVAERIGVPVVDGVAAAVKLAESLVCLGLSTSKVLSYASPREKVIRGWPLGHAIAGTIRGESL